ncbi:MAG: eukaryotic-like serine/threonine-protein kinase [Candidatus Eremiobacteraeota bacterium]|jgi:serine/threonine-protein kinase|nr:eukaryotic-like serine/threonine-protein kinase [Candidatus Eremiobacteraeota bacterium]
MARASGEVLRGRYRLGPLLGEGATGTVSRATDTVLGRDVAVKLLKPAVAADPVLVARFYAEARAAAALVHPHVVGIYDVLAEAEDGLHALVMEFIDGPSLARVLRESGPLGEARAVAYARQIASALAAAHARGLLHRDIKPANVLLAPGDTVKVADFGLAKALAGSDSGLTEAGRLVGSAAYFSPEQAQGLPLGPAADLYSLGVMLHELVTGRLPFEADSPVSLAVAHVTAPPPDEATLRRTMSPGLAALVHRLLQKDPRARLPSASALEAALAALGAPRPAWDAPTLVATIPVVAPPTRGASSAGGSRSTDTVRRALARARTAPAMLAAGIAVLAGLLGVGWSAGAHRSPTAVAAAAKSSARSVPVAAAAAARKPALVIVPNLLGMDYAEAGRAMQRLALRPSFAARISGAAAESVLAQYPAAGTQVPPGSTALVIISSGPRPAVDLRGGEAYLKLPPGQRGRHHARPKHAKHADEGDGGDGD